MQERGKLEGAHPRTHALGSPETVAIRMGRSQEVVTYRQLDERSNRVARLFRSLGLHDGDHVAILMENSPQLLEVAWGARRSGLIYTAISTRLTPTEAAYIVNDSRARVLVTSTAVRELAEALAEPGVTGCEAYLMAGGEAECFEDLERALAELPGTPLPDMIEGIDMLYSSGTTGRPKGILKKLERQPIGTPDHVTKNCAEMYEVTSESVFLSPAPLYHSGPLRFSMAMHRLGAEVIVMERFDPIEFLKLVQEHEVTHAVVVPTMMLRMLRLSPELRREFSLTSLEYFIHAAAPCPVSVKYEMIDWLGPIIHEFYSGTESNGLTACDTAEWLAHPGTVGRALGSAVHILDENGSEMPSGHSGTIYFEGGSEFEYFDDPSKTDGSRERHGWSTLGDIGHLDEDGYLYLTDRRDDTVISGGVNVYPREIEDVLLSDPGVADCAAFGVPDSDLGEIVVAAVQAADRAADQQILLQRLTELSGDRLARFKRPRKLELVDRVPRLPTGKLQRWVLRRAWDEQAGALRSEGISE